MPVVKPSDVSTAEFHQILLGTVAPRPIAFASTVDRDGNINLSPFSFFNVFSANPPILIFSPARRVRDNTQKHTLENVLEVPEACVNIVDYALVEQMSLSSTEYEKGVNEFTKTGLTPVRSELIRPPRVKESPVAYECKVIEVKALGENGGAGNLIICEVLQVYISDLLYEDGKISPHKLDVVSRMGENWYCRAQGDALFQVTKPVGKTGIGVDQIPSSIQKSTILTGNHLGKLGNIEKLPEQTAVDEFATEPEVSAILEYADIDPDRIQSELHKLAAKYLEMDDVISAWKVLLQEY